MSLNDTLPWEGLPYSVKRHGTTLVNCDSEPVRTPGCVQSHGALLVLRPETLAIVQASENTEVILGHPAAALLGASVAVVIGDAGLVQLSAFLAVEPVEANPLYVFSLVGAGETLLDVTVHSSGGVVLLEFEATDRSGAVAIQPDYYALVRKTMVRLQGATSLQAFCNITVDEVRALTGFDRVMVYKFHADGHGEVIAESKLGDLAPWIGLHYPAQDIPKPARDVFTRIWLRPMPDVGSVPAEMVPLVDPQTGEALDMTFCSLRGASVMYTEYLQNMRVTAGLTMSIRHDGELWGLIACHHYAGPRHVPYPVRAACEFLAQVASLQHRAAEDREHLESRQALEGVHQRLVTVAAQTGQLASLVEGSPGLLDAVPCTGAALREGGRWWCLGDVPNESELDALAGWVATRPELAAPMRPVFATAHLAADFAPAGAYAASASGLLAVPLARASKSLMFWFRREMRQDITWAGHPDDKPTILGPHGPRLTPRTSFDLFVESVRQRSLPWLPGEVASITRLRTLLIDLVVERAEQLSALNADLTRTNEELDAFAYVASHDLKEPLRGIHKYAHQLLENAAAGNEEQQRQVDGLMRLTLRMDSLLDSLLHFSRVGRISLDFTSCDLNLVLADAIDMVGARVEETPVVFVKPRPLPTVQADWVRCREIYVNLLSNALKYNEKPERRIEIGWIAPDESPRTPPHTSTEGTPPVATFFVRDNGIGIAERHLDQVFKMFRRLHAPNAFGGGSGAGLTIVRRLVERHGGRIWAESTPGVGSTFYFTLSSAEER